MSIRISVFLALLALLSPSSAIAEVVIATDKTDYVVGEIIHITARNEGPEDEQLVSYPYFTIWNTDTDQCVYGCLGLPVVDPFLAGQTISVERDTGQQPDPSGTYVVSVATLDGPSTTYVLTAGVRGDRSSWTTLKTRFR